MKKIFLVSVALLMVNTVIYSQNYVDNAYKFSANNYGGTARFVGMGGAFGALGGDFSSISINPAGLGVYRSSELVFSPGLSLSQNKSTYINNSIDESKYSGNVNNFGFVASYDLENSDTRWVNFNIGIGFNRINNLNDNLIFEGVNNSSLMNIFSEFARQTIDPEKLDGMYEYMLLQADLFAFDSTAMEFFNEIDDEVWNNSNFDINQRKIIKTEGSINEYSFSFGGNYAHKLYIGASIGITKLDYTQYSSHYEYETVNTPIIYVDGFDFREHILTKGTGFTLKVGAIYKPVEFLRIGASLHLPTFYSLDETRHNSVYGYFDDGSDTYARSPKQTYEYQLRTPLRATFSTGIQIGKIGLIDVDYEYADYSTMNLDDDQNSEDVILDNKDINDLYKATHNLRAGAEFRFGTIYLRGGGAYSTSPYINNDNYETITMAGGLGYREKNFFIDFAFAQTKINYGLIAYNIEAYNVEPYNWGFNNAVANVHNKMNNFILTFGLKF